MAQDPKARSGLAVLWAAWGVSLLLSLAFAALGAVTFNSLNKVYQKFPIGQDRRILHGTMAAALGAPILVVLLDLVSLFILFYKTWKHNGTGFSYGFLDASFLHQALFVALSSFVLLSDRGLIEDFKATPLWTKVDSTVYSLTYVFGFIVTGAFVLLFLLLIIFQSAVRENHRRSRRSRYPDEYDDPLLDSETGSAGHRTPPAPRD